MKIMNLNQKKEDAVSPVIGVMLMLIVTIVIAAVVAAFAGGLGSDVELAPLTALDIDAYVDGKLEFTSLSGDTLSSKEILIKVTDRTRSSLGTATLPGTYFVPGTTAILQLKDSNGNDVTKLSEVEKFVTITVLHNGKNVVTKKEAMVKAEFS